MIFSEKLRDEYEMLWNTAAVYSDKAKEMQNIVEKIKINKKRYNLLELKIGAPWKLIAAIHSLESSLNFNTHLHNGDPLSAKTIHVPKRRPQGNPTFTWEESALDALTLKKWDRWDDWSTPACLYKAEEYNGFGYRLYHKEILSPYLWSFTNHYRKGKYGSDGKFSKSLVSKQCGVVAILKGLEFI
jgi:lysozyme family protein